ncbi:MAG: LCP family protein, partial [Bacilli bacterium]
VSLITSAYLIYQILLLGPIEPIIRYIIIGIISLIDLFIIIKIIKKNNKGKNQLFIIGLILYSLANILLGTGINYIYSKIDSVNKDYINYSSSLITLKESRINSLTDCKDLNIGIISDTKSIEGFIISQDIIKENRLNEKNSLKEYSDFSEMLTDLYEEKLDAIFLSSNYITMFQSLPGYEDIANKTKVIAKKEKKMKNEDASSLIPNKTSSIKDPFTILLMGVDSEKDGMNKNTAFNGDSLILVTFNPKTLTATLMSIPRDSYVPIMCLKGTPENKITHAAWNGASCMMKTIENFTGIKIDYYAKVNFKAVVNLVDALGGVEIDVPYSFCEQNSDRKFGNNTVYVNKGKQVLNGEQALAYSRNRHTWPQYCKKEWNLGARSDIIRGVHQQEVIEAMLSKIKDIKSIDKLMELFNLISKNLDTNMSTTNILSFYNIGKDILSKGIDQTGSVISLKKLFLKTSDQMIYDERTKLVLSDQIINKGSLDDVIKAMKINLEEIKPNMEKDFNFSINKPYEEVAIGNGKYPSTKLYSLLPNLVGMTKTKAEAWGQANGVKIIFANDGTTVKSQNFPAKKRIDLIKDQTITLTLNGTTSKPEVNDKVDCSTDTDNKLCEMPDFVGKTKATVNSWINKLSGVTIKWNSVDIALANGNKVGTIIKQSISEGNYIKGTKVITLSIVTDE